ncbi:hypothetical protein GTO91_17095 [Heliobacterium undosum]|uniref:Lecithin:cholesterol acyltransferase n=1 Tax=Heliomicrobium undosum TaxID=121734 RepID=A0A845L9F9_9FIRM|nr:hypothetical protein [Heliomicrobium undosum]MZP31414.1 hypothetical protein [Heliomicrobium undosum]
MSIYKKFAMIILLLFSFTFIHVQVSSAADFNVKIESPTKNSFFNVGNVVTIKAKALFLKGTNTKRLAIYIDGKTQKNWSVDNTDSIEIKVPVTSGLKHFIKVNAWDGKNVASDGLEFYTRETSTLTKIDSPSGQGYLNTDDKKVAKIEGIIKDNGKPAPNAILFVNKGTSNELKFVANQEGKFVGKVGLGNHTFTPAIHKYNRLLIDEATKISISSNKDIFASFDIPETKLPVLYVPGIMGSSTTVPTLFSPYPTLSQTIGTPQSELKAILPDDVISLKNAVENRGVYQLEEVPYDWRFSVKDIWKQYLMPKIRKYTQASGRHYTKVDVIAHSMGGLVTRAYIQSEEYANDIDKFAMVGTPNSGAPIVYIIWNSGNCKLVDHLKFGDKMADPIPGMFSFSKTMEELYYTMTRTQMSINEPQKREQTKKFAYNFVKGLGDLNPSPDYKFILNSKSSTDGNVYTGNTFLKELNNQNTIKLLYSKQEGDISKIRTKLFVTDTESTVNNVIVNSYGNAEGGVKKANGDDTVVAEYAKKPFEINGSNIISVSASNFGKHGNMIGNSNLQNEVKKFLDNGRF